MTTVIIANFAGMQPVLDASLLPDSNAQYAENTWLYRGLIRGFRHATLAHQDQYADTQQVYRIPNTIINPPDFTDNGSTWLEYPDPFMSTIRNPTINDQWNRYYFFPSDQYNSTGANPNWPAGDWTVTQPMYASYDPTTQTMGDLLLLGIPVPTVAPSVYPPSDNVSATATVATAPHTATLTLNTVTGILVGMYISDTTITTTNATAGQASATDTTILYLTSVAGIHVGMKAANTTNPGVILSGTTVAAINVSNNQVTLSTVVLSPGVAINDVLTFTNSNQIPTDAAVQSISGNTITMNVNAAYAGVLVGDVLSFSTPTPESRAYVYTYVSAYGEEGAPSPPTLTTGDPTGTWYITVNYPTAEERANRNLTDIRIYRTVTDSAGNATYYQVTQLPITPATVTYPTSAQSNSASFQLYFSSTAGIVTGMSVQDLDEPLVINPSTFVSSLTSTVVNLSQFTAGTVRVGDRIQFNNYTVTYADSALPAGITANQQLQTVDFTKPPNDLQGVVLMANGIAAGFSNTREVWFSAPYQLWAWPAAYALSIEYPIVGLSANGSSLNVLTEGTPFVISGITPNTMTIAKISANEPCIGRGSIASAAEGAYYASPNGVLILSPSGDQNITQSIYEKEFHFKLLPWTWAAGRYGDSYVIYSKGAGILGIDPDGDRLSGLVIDNQNTNVPFAFLNFVHNVVNLYQDEFSGQLFGILDNGTVMQWNPPIGIPGSTTLWNWEWKSKKFRFTAPQQFKAFLVFFDIPPEVMITLGPRNMDPNQTFNPTTQLLIVQIYADGQLLTTREVQMSGEVLLINNGSKWTYWEVRLQGQVQVRMFKMASTVKELKAA